MALLLLVFGLFAMSCLWDWKRRKLKEDPNITENIIDKNLSKREDDWWNESGGPPVAENGKIAEFSMCALRLC